MNIYLNFAGNAQAALDFYGEVFQTKGREITRYGDLPDIAGQEVSADAKNLIMHSVIDIDGLQVNLVDKFGVNWMVNVQKQERFGE